MNPSGNLLLQFGTYGSGDGQFKDPTDITIGKSDNIYVTDQNNNRVEIFDSKGNFLSEFGTFGSGDGQFADPLGIAVDKSGNIYVVDQNNERVEIFSTNHN